MAYGVGCLEKLWKELNYEKKIPHLHKKLEIVAFRGTFAQGPINIPLDNFGQYFALHCYDWNSDHYDPNCQKKKLLQCS